MALYPSPQDLLSTSQGGAPSSSPAPAPAALLQTTQAQVGTGKSFLGNLADTATKFAGAAASKVKSFVSQEADTVRGAITGEYSVSPSDLLSGVQQTASGLGSGILKISQGFNEGVARIAKSGLEGTIGKSATQKIAASPIGDFAKVATGRQNAIDVSGMPQPDYAGEPLFSYQDIYGKARNYALENNASDDTAKTFASLTVIVALFADNPLLGPEGAAGKGALKLSEKGVKEVVEATTDDAVKAILKAENPGLNALQLDALAPAFRNATDDAQVKAALDQISLAAQAPIKEAAALPSPDELAKKAEGAISPIQNDTLYLSDLQPTVRIDTQKMMDTVVRDATISDSDKIPLINALRRYSDTKISVDELTARVAQEMDRSDALYEKLAAMDQRFLDALRPGMNAKLEDSVYLVTRQTPDGPYGIKTDGLSREARRQIEDELRQNKYIPRANETPLASVKAQAASGTTEKGAVDTAVAAAEKAAPAPVQVPKTPHPKASPFSPNLLRDISKEEMPGPIADRLAGQFPTVSRRALETVSKKLAGMKRTSDIEAMLKVLGKTERALKAGPKTKARAALLETAGKAAKTAAPSDLPKSLGELLSESERSQYIDTITRSIANKEDAALAQQEYNALWEAADQKVLDRVNELDMMRSVLEETITEHPGREVNALYRGTFLSPKDISVSELIAQRKGRQIDSRISEIMQGQMQHGVADTTEQAQKALDDFFSIREQLDAIKKELSDLRPQARVVRFLQDMVEDVPVIAREEAGALDTLGDADAVRYAYRDISGFMAHARDVYRNFEKFFGEKFPEVKAAILDPFDKSKGDLVDEVKKLGEEVDAGVVSKFGIKRGSKEDKAIMDWGEREIAGKQAVPGINFEYTTEEGLARAFGREKASQIMEAEQWFRKEYNRLIDEANEVRARIYPNDPSKLIPKRKDYFRHYQELGGDFQEIKNLFETPAGIDPNLAGISEFTSPKSKFLGFAQERLGQGSTRSAIGGFIDYAPAFAYMKHIDPHIGKFRYLRRKLAESAPVPGTTEYLDSATGKIKVRQKGINNFLEFLDDYANDLAGKTNPADRYLQKIIPGGRKTMRAIAWGNSRVKKNQILGNLSSAIAQAFNLPQGIASAKLYMLPGAERTLSSLFVRNAPMEASSFLKERYVEPLANKFKIDWVEHPFRGSKERAEEFAAWITQALDEVATKWMWNGHYAKGVAEGVADPIKYADDATRKLVAGRGIGEVPLLQKSKWFQLVAPFQLEVGNSWYVMGDWVKKKEFGALATFILASYLMNRAAEKVRGSPVVFDPIQALIQGGTDAFNEYEDDGNAAKAAAIFTGRQAGELLSNIPLGQTVAAAVPDALVQGLGFSGGKAQVFGSADPGRFGSGLLVLNALTDPLYKIIPPFAGAQVKKTIQGVQSMISGKVVDANDNLSFNTTPSMMNVVQAILFGRNATPEAREFYAQRDDLFKRIYRQEDTRNALNLEAEYEWAKVKKIRDSQGAQAAVAHMQDLEGTNKDLADAVASIAQEEADGLTGTDRLVKMLGVDNGERAKYIADTIKGIKTHDEQVSFLQNLDDKKLISDTVFKQLEVLMAGAIKAQ